MRLLRKNMRKITYIELLDKTEVIDSQGYNTGVFLDKYSEPKEIMVNVSRGTGEIVRDLFGDNQDFSYILTTKHNIPRNSIITIDNGVVKGEYRINKVSVSLNGFINYGVIAV